jgi:hypothetical protein
VVEDVDLVEDVVPSVVKNGKQPKTATILGVIYWQIAQPQRGGGYEWMIKKMTEKLTDIKVKEMDGTI